MLPQPINKFKNFIKYSQSEHKNYPKPNMIRVSHIKKINWNFQLNLIIFSKFTLANTQTKLLLPNKRTDKEEKQRKRQQLIICRYDDKYPFWLRPRNKILYLLYLLSHLLKQNKQKQTCICKLHILPHLWIVAKIHFH